MDIVLATEDVDSCPCGDLSGSLWDVTFNDDALDRWSRFCSSCLQAEAIEQVEIANKFMQFARHGNR